MSGYNYSQQARPSEYNNYQQAPRTEYQHYPREGEHEPATTTVSNEKVGKYPSPEQPAKRHVLPTWTHNGRLHTKGINPEGESGRSGFHPVHFFRVAWKSATPWNKWLNILWPFVPAAIVLHFVYKDHHTVIFAVNYIAMVPAASLLGFAGQELARKMPRVLGILTETTLGSVVEIVLFTVLIVRDGASGNLIPVIKAAILGSILTNLLLCLGFCFLVGGMKWKEQKFHPVVSETGSGLLLVAGFGLLIPTAFYSALGGSVVADGQTGFSQAQLIHNTDNVSHGTAIVLLVAFFMYIAFSMFSHDSIFDEVLRQDEELDNDRERDLNKQKFTLFEAIIAIIFSLACISLIAVFLVFEIEPLVHEKHIPDNFMGLILVPLVEKIAEHITAVDEAYDNQINFALYHCLFPSIQTALFNAPLVVIIGWGLGKNMDLNFEVFLIILVILAILVVGNFLRDGSSNALEGGLLILVYALIALAAWNMPNPSEIAGAEGSDQGSGESTPEVVAHAVRGIAAMMH